MDCKVNVKANLDPSWLYLWYLFDVSHDRLRIYDVAPPQHSAFNA